ncbi:MAG: LysM peptidoglycan-binding domain-containing protein [Gallionella sp.]
MRKIISLICFLLPVLAYADVVQIRPDAPDRHVVVKGDTLWDISAMFFKDPWKWPSIWNLNKDTIKDPHWIYPGDVVFLDRATGTLSVNGNVEPTANGIEKYEPHVRYSLSQHGAIASIPYKDLHSFLSQPLVVEEDTLASAPKLIALEEGRVILGDNQLAYASNLPADQGTKWQAYRPGKLFVDPYTGETLGREAVYLGDVEATKFAQVSTVIARKTILEINPGDRLAKATSEAADNYLPRVPPNNIKASIISIYGGVSQAGQNSVVTLNKGARDGLENGHVLALYSKGIVTKNDGDEYTLPDEQYGLIFIFRVFNKVSYGLVMNTKLPVQLLDIAQVPQ